MAECDPPPTATLSQTITQTRDQVVTSFSVVSDLSGTVSLQTLTSCAGLSTGTGGGCSRETVVTRTATVDQVVTRQVPFTQTFHDTVTVTQPTRTLFGQCRQTHSTLSTPSPTVIEVPTTSVDEEGSTYVTTMRTTTTPPPTYVPDTTIISNPVDTAPANGSQQGNGVSIGPIIGGVVGGIVGLGLIGGLVWLWWKRRKRWDDIFDDNDEVLNDRAPGAMAQIRGGNRHADLGGPNAYEYGVVGSQAPERHFTHTSYSGTSYSGISPNHSPQLSQSSNLPPVDPRYSMALPSLHQPVLYPPVSPPPTITSHSRTSSIRPGTAQSSRPSSPAHMRRRSRGPDEVIGLAMITPREMSPPQPPAAPLPSITPIIPTTVATTSATTTQLVIGPNDKRPRVVMSATPPVVVHTDGGRMEPTSPPVASSSSAPQPQRENSTNSTEDTGDAPPAYS